MNNERHYSPEDLESLSKDRPKNESEKRFILPQDEFLKERLHAVKDEVAEMQAKYPEVLSLCIFGSMVKGTAHEGSDIDGYLYIDSSLVAEREGVTEEEVLAQSLNNNQTLLSKEIAKKYIFEFRNGVKEKARVGDEVVEGIRSRPISEKVIDDEIRMLSEYHKSKEKYDLDMEAWMDSEPVRGSDLSELIAYEQAKPKRPEYVSPSLSDMFHFDVGGGIKKYRKLFVEKLSQMGEEGERMWADTIKGTEMMENNFSLDKSKRYPRTLIEALKVYANI